MNAASDVSYYRSSEPRHVGSGLIEQVASGEAPALVPLTVEQLHGMLEKGILRDGDPIELLEGLLVRKNRAAGRGRDDSWRASRPGREAAREAGPSARSVRLSFTGPASRDSVRDQ